MLHITSKLQAISSPLFFTHMSLSYLHQAIKPSLEKYCYIRNKKEDCVISKDIHLKLGLSYIPIDLTKGPINPQTMITWIRGHLLDQDSRQKG